MIFAILFFISLIVFLVGRNMVDRTGNYENNWGMMMTTGIFMMVLIIIVVITKIVLAGIFTLVF